MHQPGYSKSVPPPWGGRRSRGWIVSLIVASVLYLFLVVHQAERHADDLDEQDTRMNHIQLNHMDGGAFQIVVDDVTSNKEDAKEKNDIPHVDISNDREDDESVLLVDANVDRPHAPQPQPPSPSAPPIENQDANSSEKENGKPAPAKGEVEVVQEAQGERDYRVDIDQWKRDQENKKLAPVVVNVTREGAPEPSIKPELKPEANAPAAVDVNRPGERDLLLDLDERAKHMSLPNEKTTKQELTNENAEAKNPGSEGLNEKGGNAVQGAKIAEGGVLPKDAFIDITRQKPGENMVSPETRPSIRIFHLLGTRFAMGMGKFPNRMALALSLLETFTLPNVVKQEGPFLWVLFADPDMLPESRERLSRLISPYPFIHVAYTHDCPYSMAPLFQPPTYAGLPDINELVLNASRNADVVITTRVDADDVMHPDAFKLTRQAATSHFESFFVPKTGSPIDTTTQTGANEARSPVFALSFEGGYTWHPVSPKSKCGRLAEFHAPTHAIGMSIVALSKFDVRELNAYGFNHKEVLQYVKDECTNRTITHSEVGCVNETQLHVRLPAPGWIYVRTLLSDAKSVMRFRPGNPGNVPEKETADVLKFFNVDPESVGSFIRNLLPLYKGTLKETLVGRECGFQRNPLKLRRRQRH